MDGGLQGAASAFWSTASQGEVVSFFRHLGEDVSELDEAALQVAGRLARERLPRLSDRAVARWLAGESFPFVSPYRRYGVHSLMVVKCQSNTMAFQLFKTGQKTHKRCTLFFYLNLQSSTATVPQLRPLHVDANAFSRVSSGIANYCT